MTSEGGKSFINGGNEGISQTRGRTVASVVGEPPPRTLGAEGDSPVGE